MAVFTDITNPRYREQFAAIEEAFAFPIARIDPIAGGSTDSKFVVASRDRRPYVLTIHESPRVSAAGVSSEVAKRSIRYTEYLADALSTLRDRHGKPIRVRALKPRYPRSSQAPYLELNFDGELRPITIVPFIDGKAFKNLVDEAIIPRESYLAGRAVAACFLASQSYPDAASFAEYDFAISVDEIGRLIQQQDVVRRLEYVFSRESPDTSMPCQDVTSYLAEMYDAGQELLAFWQSSQTGELDQGLIHGDLFTDNTILQKDETLIVFDFSHAERSYLSVDVGAALNSWGAVNYAPRSENMLEFLAGSDSVHPFQAEHFARLPFYAELGAFRWETFRIQRIERQDPRQHFLRSPAEFRHLRKAWRNLRVLFAQATSLEELSHCFKQHFS